EDLAQTLELAQQPRLEVVARLAAQRALELIDQLPGLAAARVEQLARKLGRVLARHPPARDGVVERLLDQPCRQQRQVAQRLKALAHLLLGPAGQTRTHSV